MRLLLVLAAACVALGATARAADAPTLLIRDVRVFDGYRALDHRSVLVRGGVIAEVAGPGLKPPRGATVVEGAGRTLLPGIIDAHVHVSHTDPDKTLAQSARFGVTTDLDMFTGVATLKRMHELSKADLPNLADVRSAGVGASAPNGHPSRMDPKADFPTLSRPEDAQAFVDARIAEGSDYIKIIADDGSPGPLIPHLDEATIRAVVAAAHRRGKMAVVHIQTEAWARVAIDAGADGLVHIFVGQHASPDFGAFARAHRIFVVPTLGTEYSSCNRSRGTVVAADPRLAPQIDPGFARGLTMRFTSPRSCQASDEAVKELHAAGVPILVGTDAPVPGTTYGASTLDEMGLLVADGLTPTEALSAGTSVPARIFGLTDRGEIKPGKRADLVLVAGDPTADIDAVKNIVAVWKHGMPVERKAAPPAGATQ